MPSPKGQTRRREADEGPDDGTPAAETYASPSMEVLETLEMQNALTNLEARLDSLEIDLARASGSREDDSRRLSGEMAVMKARVEDALTAFAGTAQELRSLVGDAAARLDAAVARGFSREPDAIRAELQAGIDGVMAGVGDVLESMASDVRSRIEGLGAQMAEVQASVAKVAEGVSAIVPMAERLAALEERVRSA